MKFSEQLKLLRKQRNVTQIELAESIGVSDRMVQIYERGTKEPTLSKLLAIADFFHVSIDYLVGRTDNPEINK